jgi:hypothetical protein
MTETTLAKMETTLSRLESVDADVEQPRMDPVTFEVLRNALVNVTEEMALTIRRAAYSTNIKTRADFSCAFFDNELRCVAQSFAQPAHLVSMATITPASIREYGLATIRIVAPVTSTTSPAWRRCSSAGSALVFSPTWRITSMSADRHRPA